ncbi:methyl-accepting chemotaxis protein ['Paenibacillus yunnanensis' Narsing Rao et al. 2020]|uniref:methyl-accepting chemotaxis protein n=1 Tax=Paenibacillus tengchongensis TaxID=2608684 RepID=UPI00124D2691|nr:methyl-accepting chemotaxis protein [Paenibacillus tengchongensis]
MEGKTNNEFKKTAGAGVNDKLKLWGKRAVRETKTMRGKMIVSFLAVLLIPSLAITFFSYKSAKDEVRSQIRETSINTMELTRTNIGQYMLPIMNNLDEYVQMFGSDAADTPEQSVNFLDIIISSHPEISSIIIGNDEGAYIDSSDDEVEGYDPREQEWYKQSMADTSRIYIGEPTQNVSTGKWIITLAKAMPDGHGSMTLNIDLDRFVDSFKSVSIGESGILVILDESNKIVAGSAAVFDVLGMKVGDVFAASSSEGQSEQVTGSEAPAGQPEAADSTAAQPPADATVEPQGELTTSGKMNGDGMPAAAGEIPVSSQIVPYGDLELEVYSSTEPMTGWKMSGMIFTSEYTAAARPILYKSLMVMGAAMLLSGILIFIILRSFLVALTKLRKGVREISEGDLSARVHLQTKDEFGQLASDFNQMAESVQRVVTEINETSGMLNEFSQAIKESTDQTAQSVKHVAETTQETAEAAISSAESSGEAANAMEEMARGVGAIAESAGVIVDAASRTEQEVAGGSRTIHGVRQQMDQILGSVARAGELMEELSRLSGDAGRMSEAITDIANQTGLLSLNASIEAARAGEHGRGFAVVAGEVRKLSDQAKLTAKDIGKTLGRMLSLISESNEYMNSEVRSKVNEGLRISEEATMSFGNIERSTSHIVDQIQGISAVAEQMSASTQQVSATVTELAGMSKQTAEGAETTSAAAEEQLAAMEAIAASSQELAGLAFNLTSVVSKFKV